MLRQLAIENSVLSNLACNAVHGDAPTACRQLCTD